MVRASGASILFDGDGILGLVRGVTAKQCELSWDTDGFELAWISTAHNLPNIFAFSALLDQAERGHSTAGRRRVLHEEAAQGLVLSLARRRWRLEEAAAFY